MRPNEVLLMTPLFISITTRIWYKQGSNNSWYALAWIAPERDFAVLATTNIGGDEIFKKIDAVIWAVIQNHIKRGGE